MEPNRLRAAPAALAGAAVLALGFFYLHQYLTLGALCAPLDDTFIHLRFAWNIAHGHGFAFNPDHPIPGSTSPLWVIILVPFALGSKSLLLTAALILSSLSHLAAGTITYYLARRVGLKNLFALLAAALVLFNGRLLWAAMSGMETNLFAAVTLAAALLYLREAETKKLSWKTGALLGIATAVRPEGYLFAAGIMLHFIISSAARDQNFRPGSILRRIPKTGLIVYLALIAPYIIFSLITIHYPLPSTFLAKQPEMAPLRAKYLYWSLTFFLLDNPAATILFFAAAITAGYRAVRDKLGFIAAGPGLIAGWALGYLALSALFTPMPFHYCRYQLPLLPFFLIMAMSAAQDFTTGIARRLPGPSPETPSRARRFGPAVVLALALLVPQAVSTARWPAITTLCAGNIRQMHVAVGELLHRLSAPGDRVATMDIGAIGFYSEREIVDLFGLITPEVLPYFRQKGFTRERSESMLRYLWKVQPEYVAIFPEAFPSMLDDRRVFAPVFEVRLKDKQVIMADWMVVCHCLWYKGAPPKTGAGAD